MKDRSATGTGTGRARGLALLAGMLAVLAGGCAVEHLSPRTGQALDRILDRIDLSPRQDNTEFPIRREAAKFTNAQLDEYRWGVARRILKLQNRLLHQSDSAPYTLHKEE